MIIYLASDHAGFELKEAVEKHLEEQGHRVEDLGTHSEESVNYAEYGARAAAKVSQDPENSRGIIICGTGIGMSMVSNKFKYVRAALCTTEFTAEMSRQHNNANVLNMGARTTNLETALKIVDIFLNTAYEDGRHQQRLDYIHQVVERENFK